MSLGALVVRLGLDAAEFVAGMDKADYKANATARNIAKALDAGVAAGITALGTLATAALGMFAVLDQTAEQVAGFQDLADAMGDTAEQVASLSHAADLSGTAMETVSAASVRMTASLSKAGEEGKAAGQALKALGIDFDDFKRQAPAQQMETLARAMGDFEDGASKTALAVALFGKAGAEMIPFLNDLNAEGGRYVRLTAEQIKAADDYTKSKARLTSQIRDFVQVISMSALPVLLDLSKAVLAVVNEVIGLDNETARLESSNKVASWAEASIKVVAFLMDAVDGVSRAFEVVGKSIGAVIAQAKSAATLNFSEYRSVSVEYERDLIAIADRTLAGQKLLRQFEAERAARLEAARDGGQGAARPGRTLNFQLTEAGSKGKDPDAEAKSYLENLQRAEQKLADLTTLETLLSDISSGRLKVTSESLKDQLIAQAAVNDLLKDQAEREKEIEKIRKAAADEFKADQRDAQRIMEDSMGLVERTAKQAERIEELRDLGHLSDEQAARATEALWDRALAKTEARAAETNAFLDQAKRNAQSLLGDLLSDSVLGKFEGGLARMAASWAEAMAKMASQAAAAKLMGAAFGGSTGGGGWFGAIFGGGRAGGGPTAPGTSYLVGENGPELLTMGSTPGYVTPNGAIGGETNVTTIVNVGENGSSSQRLQRGDSGAGQLSRSLEQLVTARIQAETQQGGVLWRQRMGYA